MYAWLSAGVWDGNSNGEGRSSAWLALDIGRNRYPHQALEPSSPSEIAVIINWTGWLYRYEASYILCQHIAALRWTKHTDLCPGVAATDDKNGTSKLLLAD